MALGKKQQAAEPEPVVLEPQQAYDASVVSIMGWLAELKTRQAAFEEAVHELRVSGKYPNGGLFGGLFDVCASTEMAVLRKRPELFGGPAPESRERSNVRQARTDLQHAEEAFAKIQKNLAAWRHDDGEQAKQAWISQLESWGKVIRQYRTNLVAALRQCDDLSTAEHREIITLTTAEREKITIEI